MENLQNYIIALTNLHGLISPEKVLEIYSNQNDADISKETLEDSFNTFIDESRWCHVYVEEGLFVHEDFFMEEGSLVDIYESRNLFSYYVPDKDELLNYADSEYFEKNESYEKLANYFLKHVFDGDRWRAEDIATEIHDYLSMEPNNVSGVMVRLEQLDVPLKHKKKAEKVVSLVSDYAKNIRSWHYNGYTLNEFLEKTDEVVEERVRAREEKLAQEIESMSLLEKYIIALTNLYGRVTKEKVAEVYNRQNKEQTTAEEVSNILNNPPEVLSENLIFSEWGEFLTEDLVLFEDSYETLKKKQQGKPHYIPTQNQLFKYLDHYYVDYPKEFDELVEYLEVNIYEDEPNKAEIIAEDMHLAMAMGDGVEGAFSEFNRDGFIFEDEEEIDRLVERVTHLNNHTRIRENNGFTPYELREIKNIGRNDPCYCGSGKKYKKCCLKKDQRK